jgi:hypothetical protein
MKKRDDDANRLALLRQEPAEVKKLIAGPTVTSVTAHELRNDIIAEEGARTMPPAPARPAGEIRTC